MMASQSRAARVPHLAIFYEHPEWFKPLFAELDRKGVVYDRLLAHEHQFDPTERQCPYSLIVNRMSPSAYTRGHSQAIFYTLQYMADLKEIGANVLHGYDTYVYEFSKARQISLLHRLCLRHPRARVINHSSQARAAAEGLTFPVILKPNIGGSGARIVRFDLPKDLRVAAEVGTPDLGIDGTALLHEYLAAEGNSIVRVEASPSSPSSLHPRSSKMSGKLQQQRGSRLEGSNT
jgi:glutathione synthase/RimK-type ligase-like ATP-grasp enzyme